MQIPKKQYKQKHLVLVVFLAVAGFFFVLHSLSYAQKGKQEMKDFGDPSPALNTALSKAESFANKKQFSKAQKTLTEYASSRTPNLHPLLFYELGYFAYKAGDTKNAISSLQKCVKIAPGYKDGWQLLSLAWQESGTKYSKEKKEEKSKRIKAMQNSAMAMEKAVQLSGDDNLRYQSAMLWLEGEKAKTALTILERLSKKKSPKEEWLVGLAQALQAMKDKKKTAEAMEKAARIQNTPELLFHAAYLWNELDKPKRALPLLVMLVEKKNPNKNWFLLLASVYNTLKQHVNAAMAFEKVIELDPAPEYLYNCGVLWLQAEKPDNALKSLLQLAEVSPPKADWFVATAQAWLIKKNITKAADAMERAADISKKPEHIYQAGSLRLQLKQADRAITLLTPLAKLKNPKKQWLVTLANAWLLKENYTKGATYMEMAANISGEGKLYHRAGMLWRIEERFEKTINLLRKSVATKEVQQLWLIDLASVLLEVDRENESRSVMKQTKLSNKEVSNQLRYRGVVIWLSLQEPERAYPLLKMLAADQNPQYSWLSTLVKNCVELGKMTEADKVLSRILDKYPSQVKTWKLAVWFAMQQGEYVDAVAAKEIVLHFEPDKKKHIKDLSRLYLLAGVPKKAASFYVRTLDKNPDPKKLQHLIDIYQSGKMYEKALNTALKVVKKEKTVENLEVLGDIYYSLHRYDESGNAYEQAAKLSNDPAPDIFIKAAYSAMKKKRYERATENFQAAITSGKANEDQIQAATQNLAYIKKVKEQREL